MVVLLLGSSTVKLAAWPRRFAVQLPVTALRRCAHLQAGASPPQDNHCLSSVCPASRCRWPVWAGLSGQCPCSEHWTRCVECISDLQYCQCRSRIRGCAWGISLQPAPRCERKTHMDGAYSPHCASGAWLQLPALLPTAAAAHCSRTPSSGPNCRSLLTHTLGGSDGGSSGWVPTTHVGDVD